MVAGDRYIARPTKRHSSTIGVAEVSWTQTAGARQYRLRVAKRKWPMSSLVTALTEFLTGIKASDQEIGRLTMSGRSSRPGKLRVRSLKVHEIRRTYFPEKYGGSSLSD